MIMSRLEAGGPEDYDAPLEWRPPSDDQFAVMPPSITSSLPVTQDDSSEAR
jgi:hypothetical protein